MEVFMRAGLAGLFVFLLSVQSADAPQDVLNRSIQARGGDKQLAQVKAVQLRVSGKVYRGNVPLPFVANILSQLPDQYKHVMDYQREARAGKGRNRAGLRCRTLSHENPSSRCARRGLQILSIG